MPHLTLQPSVSPVLSEFTLAVTLDVFRGVTGNVGVQLLEVSAAFAHAHSSTRSRTKLPSVPIDCGRYAQDHSLGQKSDYMKNGALPSA